MESNLEKNKIKSGFITPSNYFEIFSDDFFETYFKETNLNFLPKNSGFVVPENYFKNNETILIRKIKSSENKVFYLKNTLIKAISIAAVLLLSIISPLLYNSEVTYNNEMATLRYLELHSEELSVYEIGSMLDNDEIFELENELIYTNLNNIN